MTSNIEKYKNDIAALVKGGEAILKKIKDNDTLAVYRQNYEMWYSESLAVIKIILPDRVTDFSKMYYDDKSKIGLKTYFQSLRDVWAIIEEVPQHLLTRSVLDSQIGILKSCQRRFESSLFDIKQLLQSDIFISELEAARELNKKGFTRGAGAVAGVVLEGHLKQVCINHKIPIKKANPTISVFNDLLKESGVIETPMWRSIQFLGDLRNLCDHKKPAEPTKEEIKKLIDGVDEINKTLF